MSTHSRILRHRAQAIALLVCAFAAVFIILATNPHTPVSTELVRLITGMSWGHWG